MKIATFNINNINSRLPVLLKWLKSAKPDVLCLQELKCETNVLLNNALALRLTEGGVDTDVRGEEGASDHAPAWIKLK